MALDLSQKFGMRLEDYISSVLHRPAVQKIHFFMNGIMIAGHQYKLVGNRVSGGELKLYVVDPKKLRNEDVAAFYSSVSDILIVTPDGVLSPYFDLYIVHEATHAVMRYMQAVASHLKRFQNEGIAYIAGALYIRLSGQQLPANAADIFQAADTIAQKILATDTGGKDYQVTDQDYAPLEDAIGQNPTYKGRNQILWQGKPWSVNIFDVLLTTNGPAPLLSGLGDM